MTLVEDKIADLTIELLKNLSVLSLLTILLVHRYPQCISYSGSAFHKKGLLLFSLISLAAMAFAVKTPGVSINFQLAPIILAAIYAGLRESITVALLAVLFHMIMGDPFWISWGLTAVFSGPLVRLICLRIRNRQLGLLTASGAVMLLAMTGFALLTNLAAESRQNITSKSILELYLPLFVGTITGTLILDWVFTGCRKTVELHASVVEAETKYRHLVENSLVGFYIVQSGRFVYANQAMCDITGYSEQEMLEPKTIALLFGKQNAQYVKRQIKQFSDTNAGSIERELPIFVKSGMPKHVAVYGRVLELHGLPAIIGTAVDITQRKQYEEELVKSQKRIDSIIAVLPDLLCVARKDGLLTEILTPSHEALFLPVVPLQGKYVQQVLDTKATESIQSAVDKALSTKEPQSLEYQIAGHERTLSREVRLIAINEEEVLAIVRDITERKQMEERFRVMANNVPILMWMDDEQGLCTFVNQRWLAYTGSSAEENRGLEWIKYIHPEDRQRTMLEYDAAREWREKYASEYRLRRFDGEYRWMASIGMPQFTASGHISGYVGCCIDIHDEKLAEDILQQANELLERRIRERTLELEKEIADRQAADERYRILFNTVQDALFLWELNQDGSPGRFVEVNEVACRRLGYVREEMLSLSPLSITVVKGRKKLAFIADSMRKHGSVIFETEQVAKDGSVVPVEINASLLAFNGITVGMFMARDITERKKAEFDLFYARERSAKVEKLAFLGTIAAGIAHEVNQPLNAIKVLADSMVLWVEDGEDFALSEFVEDVKTISRQAERAAGIIQYVRNIIRVNQQMKRDSVNVNNVVGHALSLLEPQLHGKQVMLITELDDQLPMAFGSVTHLEHALINLITNAVQASESLGKSDIWVAVRTRFDGGIIVEVADNGPGIAQEQRDRIFDAFYTTKEEGMGMGLPIVQSVVASHGGKIMVSNNEWGGATFTLFLPLAVGETEGGAGDSEYLAG